MKNLAVWIVALLGRAGRIGFYSGGAILRF